MVWWRLAIAAPTTASLPSHVEADLDDEDSGPLHHRFAIANYKALVDGLGVAVSLGRLRPDEAGALAQAHVATLGLAAPR